MAEESYKFFENFNCKYHPCHNVKEQNCLFCFCPLYFIKCIDSKKDCMNCTFPHDAKNYEKIIKILTKDYNDKKRRADTKRT